MTKCSEKAKGYGGDLMMPDECWPVIQQGHQHNRQRASAILSARSQYVTQNLADHAYLTPPPLAVGSGQDSLPSTLESALMAVHLDRPNRRRGIESSRSQFDTGDTTRECDLNEMAASHQASAHGSVREAPSLREDDVENWYQCYYPRKSPNRY